MNWVAGAHQGIRIMSAEAAPPGDKRPRDAKRSADRSAASAPRQPFADPAKEYVMSCLLGLVLDGIAQWNMLENGDMELRFKSGETYLLGDETVTRTA
jgi:hypothetical protein